MTFFDSIIIYFSCGSPFAVNVLLTSTGRSKASVATRAALEFVAWPVFAASSAIRLIRNHPNASGDTCIGTAAAGLNELLTKLESVSHQGRKAPSTFEFRNTFARYTGLAIELSSDSGQPEASEIAKITGHPNPAAASACTARNRRTRLTVHLIQARRDFIEAVADLALVANVPRTVKDLAIEIAEKVGDLDGVRDLVELFGKTAVPDDPIPSAAELEHLWSTTETSRSIAR